MALNFANNNSLSAIDTKPSGLSGGALNLISTQTASSSSTISFTSGIDDTYDSYVFKFYDIHPNSNSSFTFNFSTDGGSNYATTKTTTFFDAFHNEQDTGANIFYETGIDQAQSTAFQTLGSVGNANDETMSGMLQIFNPSSTTFVKHFLARVNKYFPSGGENYTGDVFVAGYGNTTSAINAVQFKMSSGNIDSGVIKLYGVS